MIISNVHVIDSKIFSFQFENFHKVSNKSIVAKIDDDVDDDVMILLLKIFQFIHENINFDVIYVLVNINNKVVSTRFDDNITFFLLFVIKIEIFYFFKLRNFRRNKRSKRKKNIEKVIDENIDENIDDELIYLKHEYVNQLICLLFELNIKFDFQ